MRVRSRRLPLLALVLAGMALSAPPGAGAATVVNGDFETGTLEGWSVYRATQAGNWFAYKSDSEPLGKGSRDPIAVQRGRFFPQEPPQGFFAATSDELTAETMVLSQEIALAPGLNHRLSLLAYYDSRVPIAVPAPDTLSVGAEQANQQFRIDVTRPGAPIESLDPADLLGTAFRTQPGASQHLQPSWVTLDLSPFAGQTVRLRIANAAGEELFTAGVDAVAVDSTQPGERPPPLGSNRFTVPGGDSGGPLVKRVGRNGVAFLSVKVPGPGKLTAKGKLIKRTTAKAAKAGKVRLRLQLTKSALATLLKKGRLRAKVAVTFDPAGGKPRTVIVSVVFKLAQS